MDDAFLYDFKVRSAQDSTAVRTPGFLRLPGWEKLLLGDLKEEIWKKSMAKFQKFEDIDASEDLSLWLPEESKQLSIKQKLKDVFKGAAEKEVSVTPAGAENWNVAFVVKGTPVPQGATEGHAKTLIMNMLLPQGLKLPLREPKPERAVPTLTQILDFCSGQNSHITAVLKEREKSEDDFKRQFSRSSGEVCTIDYEKPCLLWDGLINGNAGSALEHLVRTAGNLCLLYGPSGVGKTRSLFELGCRFQCLFLIGMPESEQADRAHGSADLRAVAEHLLDLFPNDEAIAAEALGCCIGALLCARFFTYSLVLLCRPLIPHWEWLFFQSEFPAVSDEFCNLTKLLLRRYVFSDSDFSELGSVFKEVVSFLIAKTEWNGFVAIDECQQVERYLKGRFNSVTLGARKRSMFIPLLSQLQRYPVGSVFLSGTGQGLLSIRPELSSGSLKPYKVHEHTNFSGFYTQESMEEYVGRYVDKSLFDMSMIFRLYKGRYRFLVTALETYMVCEEDVDANRFFLKFAEDTCTKPGNELGHLRSVRDDVQKFLSTNSAAVTSAKKLAIAYYFGGAHAFLFAHHSSMKLVEYGLGRVILVTVVGDRVVPVNENDRGLFVQTSIVPTAIEDFGSDKAKLRKQPYRAVIDEPLVITALLKQLQISGSWEEDLAEEFHTVADSDAAIGERYEKFCTSGIGRYFHGRPPADLLNQGMNPGARAPPIYYEECALVECEVEHMVPLVKTVDSDYRLGKWLDEIQSSEVLCSTYLHTGPDKSCGPDVIFMLQVRSSKQYVPVLCQMRSGDPKQGNALCTLSLKNLYKHNSQRRVDERDQAAVLRLQQMCHTGFIQLVVTTSLEDLSKSRASANRDRRQSARVKEKEEEEEEEKEEEEKEDGDVVGGAQDESEHEYNDSSNADEQEVTDGNLSVRPLVGFVDECNAHLFIEKWCRDLVEAMKPKRKRRRV